ncbi:transmembrane protein 6/97 [Cristinia sonorae]|uniref:Efficient mitochondria targeting-associated protein 19 n=1 Tax=Cristinia sonorae TaxID=1940300 RepID=A0A8K0XT18_9AGAR|nr:transmembrane protein 6/97 [Cristinia sonorae]
MAQKSLTSRPLDLLYFVFFLIHIPNTILVDCQALYPKQLVPDVIANLPKLYVGMSNDPLIGPAMGYFGAPENYVWFKSFLLLEAFFQLPVFLLGLRGLWNGSKSIYVLLLVYAASTTTTVIPCLAVLLNTPLASADTAAKGIIAVTASQRLLLLSSYVPFLLIPLLMTVDMAFRTLSLLRAGLAAQNKIKTR